LEGGIQQGAATCFFQDSVKDIESVFFEFIAGQQVDATKPSAGFQGREKGGGATGDRRQGHIPTKVAVEPAILLILGRRGFGQAINAHRFTAGHMKKYPCQ
jgi:hypothetical protein